MKLLFINSSNSDYVEDQLLAGLTEILGASNVVLFPVNINYYFSRRPYPRNMGVSRKLTQYVPDLLAAKKQLRRFDFDAVVIGSTKADTFTRFLEIAEHLPKHIPIIYVDGGDWPEVGGDANRMHFAELYRQIVAKHKFKLVFKRECLQHITYDANVIPFPMAFKPPLNYKKAAAKYDVTCWCVESDPIRTQALGLLEDRFDCRANGSTKGQTFRKYKRKGNAYILELSASKIACNFRGVGWDTLRYWEIPGVQTLMISGRPGIIIPDNFKHEEHVIFCKDDLSDLIDKANYFLTHDKEREEIATRAFEYVNTHHTHVARARYFLQHLAEKGLRAQ